MSKPRLTEKLKGLLAGSDAPVIGPNTAAELRTWLEQAEASQPALATPQQIDEAVSMLSLALKEKGGMTAKDATAKLTLFCTALDDVTGSDLARGAAKLLKTATFMPTPAELRNASLSFATRRFHAMSRARHLLWKHKMEWTAPPAEVVPADELKGLLAAARHDLTQKDEPA